MRAMWMAVMAVATVAVPAAAQGEAPIPKPPKATTELLAKGRASFEMVCAACHGTLGDGNGPAGMVLVPKPRHFGKDPLKQGDSVDKLFATLQSGVKDTPMVAYAHLPEEERWALSYYVLHFLPSKEGKRIKKLVDALPPLAPAPAAATP